MGRGKGDRRKKRKKMDILNNYEERGKMEEMFFNILGSYGHSIIFRFEFY